MTRTIFAPMFAILLVLFVPGLAAAGPLDAWGLAGSPALAALQSGGDTSGVEGEDSGGDEKPDEKKPTDEPEKKDDAAAGAEKEGTGDAEEGDGDEATEGDTGEGDTGNGDQGDDDDDDGKGNGKDGKNGGGFETGELADDQNQEQALEEWRAASRKQAEAQVKRGYYLIAGGAVTAAGATFFGVRGAGATSRRNDAAEVCAANQDPNSTACQDSIRYGRDASTSFAVGAALGVTGITLAALGAHNLVIGQRVKAEFNVGGGPGHAMLYIHGTF